jgi:G3E family GTPase
VKAIEALMEKRGQFDYILLETTGLADPGISLYIFVKLAPFFAIILCLMKLASFHFF